MKAVLSAFTFVLCQSRARIEAVTWRNLIHNSGWVISKRLLLWSVTHHLCTARLKQHGIVVANGTPLLWWQNMHWNELDIVEGTISKGRGKAAFLPQKMIEKGDSGACYHQKSIEKGPSYLCEPSHGMWLARCLLGLDLNYLWCLYLPVPRLLGVLYTKNRTKFRFVTVRNGRKKSLIFLFVFSYF